MEHETQLVNSYSGRSFLNGLATVYVGGIYSATSAVTVKFTVPGCETIRRELNLADKITIESLGSTWEAIYSELYTDSVSITVIRIFDSKSSPI